MPSLPVVWGKCKWLAAIYNISSLFLCNYSIESTCGMLVALCFWRVKGRTCIKFSGVDKLNVFLRVDTRTRLHYLDNDCILKHFGLIDTYPLSLTILAGSICLLLIIYNPSSVNSNFYINYIYIINLHSLTFWVESSFIPIDHMIQPYWFGVCFVVCPHHQYQDHRNIQSTSQLIIVNLVDFLDHMINRQLSIIQTHR